VVCARVHFVVAFVHSILYRLTMKEAISEKPSTVLIITRLRATLIAIRDLKATFASQSDLPSYEKALNIAQQLAREGLAESENVV
jgi:hypothetical protein